MNTDLSDGALIMLYAGGDATAFYTLYDRYKKKLYTFLYRRTKQEELANDLFQSTWEKVIIKKDDLADKAKADDFHFVGYLFTIAYNKMLDFYKNSHQSVLSLDGLSNSDNQSPLPEAEDKNPLPLEQLQQEEDTELLLKAIDSLPDKQREVFLLRRAELKFETIAEIQGVSVDTVKSRFRYALIKIQKQLNLGDDHE